MPPNRQFYVAHAGFTLTNRDSFNRGDVLRGADASQFEADVASGSTDINNATPVATDPEAGVTIAPRTTPQMTAPASTPTIAAVTTAAHTSA